MSQILNRYHQVKQRIADACVKSNRKKMPMLLAVSKKHGVEKISAIQAEGQCDFGESYLQEASEKINQLSDLRINWHFIGPIQSNKAKLIAQNFQWVHSVDRLKVLKLLNQGRADQATPINVLLQLKVGDEDSKSGASHVEIMELAARADEYEGVSFRGMMCIPPPSQDFNTQSDYFKTAKSVFDELAALYDSVDTLSMGMSGDLEAAIGNGATVVRVGTDIFGTRPA